MVEWCSTELHWNFHGSKDLEQHRASSFGMLSAPISMNWVMESPAPTNPDATVRRTVPSGPLITQLENYIWSFGQYIIGNLPAFSIAMWNYPRIYRLQIADCNMTQLYCCDCDRELEKSQSEEWPCFCPKMTMVSRPLSATNITLLVGCNGPSDFVFARKFGTTNGTQSCIAVTKQAKQTVNFRPHLFIFPANVIHVGGSNSWFVPCNLQTTRASQWNTFWPHPHRRFIRCYPILIDQSWRSFQFQARTR